MRALLVLPLVLAACGATGLPEVVTPDAGTEGVEAAAGTEAAEAAPEGSVSADTAPAGSPPAGVFAFLRAPPAVDGAPDAAPPEAEAAAQPGPSGDTQDASPEDADGPDAAPRGFLAFLRTPPAGSGDGQSPVATSAAQVLAAPGVGLFGRNAGDGAAFGEVTTVCGLDARDLGTTVDTNNGWRLHDTDPRATRPRPMHLTGFKDGCARRFTAALVLFGSAAAHETVRYTTSSAYSETDTEYEAIKARVCGVRIGSPCPADRITRMESQVTFVTAYPAFGPAAGDWLEILLHGGEMRAASVTRR